MGDIDGIERPNVGNARALCEGSRPVIFLICSKAVWFALVMRCRARPLHKAHMSVTQHSISTFTLGNAGSRCEGRRPVVFLICGVAVWTAPIMRRRSSVSRLCQCTAGRLKGQQSLLHAAGSQPCGIMTTQSPAPGHQMLATCQETSHPQPVAAESFNVNIAYINRQ